MRACTGAALAALAAVLFWLAPVRAGAPVPGVVSIVENAEVNGFVEVRAGCRTGEDPGEDRASVMEARLQLELFTYTDHMDMKFKGDVAADGIMDRVEFDPREAWIFTRALGGGDLTMGRQVLTWGTGDLVFLNDLFPKDWQSFFTGRDAEYLKAPSDAVKLSLFSDLADVDLVYTPLFDPDRYITGEYLSFWNAGAGRITGREGMAGAARPGRWFRDHELACRIYRAMANWELALYGYRGFWKTPAGSDGRGRAVFPRLNVYGASIRGPVAGGIGNLELAWYDSREDRGGGNPLVDNSQLRFLAGYARDLGGDLNASLQYYMEHILGHGAYESGLGGQPAKDRFRHLITVQVTQLLLGQTLELSLSGYFCPGDQDLYLKPCLGYQYTDEITLEAGANIFRGREPHTFFGQFENNNNVYAAIRYHF